VGKLNELMNLASSNVGFLVLSIVIVAILIGVAYGLEVIIAKKQNTVRNKEQLRIKKMIIIAMLAGVAVVLMHFEFPLWFVPNFYKLDFSEIPIIVGAFTLGPVAGLLIEFLKVILNLLIEGSDSAFVGEFANFLIGSAFVIPASFLYFLKKNRKNAILGLSLGTMIATVAGGILNAFVLLPKYAQLMGPGMGLNYDQSMNYFVGEGNKVNSAIEGISTFVLLGVTPFNLIKYGAVSIIAILIYKKISYIMKAH
jgi:riboflavin transporter FmnP